jgi:uncharacterized membrane protein YfcA
VTWALALVVGTVGGIYGIGGGSLLAPVLLIAGFSAYEVAPATLASTFLTSIVGVAAYQVLQITTVAPSRRSGLSVCGSASAVSRAATLAPASNAASRKSPSVGSSA